MQGKRRQLIFGLIGLGCGIVLSGIFNLVLLLNTTEYKNGITLNGGQVAENAIKTESQKILVTTPANVQDIEQKITMQETAPKQTQQVSSPNIQETTKDDQQVTQKQKRTITVIIPPNRTASETCDILEAEGVIKDARDFRKYIKERKLTTKLNEGTFIFDENMSYDEIVQKLVVD